MTDSSDDIVSALIGPVSTMSVKIEHDGSD